MGNSLTARAGLAVAAGVAVGLAFPPYELWWLMPVGVAGLTLAAWGTRARHGAALGFVGGLAFFLILLRWLTVIGLDAWLLVAVLEAAFWIPLGIGLAFAPRLRGWPLWTAGLWVLTETLRSSVPFGGLPWGQLAFATVDTPLLPLSALGGTALVTFLAALVGNLLALAVLGAATRRLWQPGVAVAGAGALVVVPLWLPGAPEPSGSVRAAVVQGNVPQLGLDFHGQRKAVLNNHVEATNRLAGQVAGGEVEAPDFAIWPENASDINPFADKDAYRDIDSAVRNLGVPVLVGALVDTPDGVGIENSGIVWDPDAGPLSRYVKRHPVPFGEYIPFRSVLTRLGIERFDRIPRDFVQGPRPGLLDVGGVTVGDVICFEVAYDGLVHDVVAGGAELLVVQTNNATYGRTGQPEQQFAISRFRAAEQQRTVLVAATSGISGIIDPDGSVREAAPEFREEVLIAEVALSTERTMASRLGSAPDVVFSLAGVVALLLGLQQGRSRRQRPASPAAGSSAVTPAAAEETESEDPEEVRS